MRVNRCKGTRDLAPDDMARFHLVEGVFRDRCLKWGYNEIKTPILEYLHLFTSTGTLTPTMLGRVYSFLDWDGWSGERVVLRPDVTIPVARFYIESVKNNELAKLFYVANVFIFEETGEKTRERWQCGAELIGAGSSSADVELIALALEILKRLGLDGVKVRLSHAGLIRGLLQKLGLSPEERDKVFDQILDGDVEALSRVKAEMPGLEKALAPWLDMKGKSSGFVKNLKSIFLQNLPELKPQVDDFISTVNLLQDLGCDFQIDVASARGFEYYTGVIFQLFAGEEKIGGGGRYDALIPLMGGKETPASGFALYLDHLMKLIKPESLGAPTSPRILVGAEPAQPEAVKTGFDIAGRLREAGYVAELDLGGQKSADFRWKLDVRSGTPMFVLTDQVGRRKFEAQTADEILALLNR